MKSLFALLTFSLFCLSIFSQQSYGVSFENSLETSGGGWSSSSSNGIFWTTSAVVAPTITGIDPIAQNDDHFAYSETNGTFSGSQAISYLESPCFDLAMDTVNRVRFFYQLLGTVSDFNLEVSYDGGETYNETVSSISTMEQTNWTVQDIMGLNISNGSDAVRFRFAVTFDAGGSSIVAIDPFQLFGIPQSSPTDCPDLDCVENLTLNNTTLSEKFYRAKNQLTSNASIAANNHVTFTAGNQIILREGFIASNTNFTARIEDCNSTGVFQLVEDYTRSNLPFASEIDYFDAFGNGYTQNELEFELLNDDTICYAGVFQLNFEDDVTEEEQAVTCAVFSYLDSLIVTTAPDSSVVIDIRKDTLESGIIAAASPLWDRLDCGIANSQIEKILIGADKNQFGLVHGLVFINSLFQDRFFTDLFTEPDLSGGDDTLIHFYSVMLHEALHVLGFVSLIDEGSTPLDINGEDQIVSGIAFSRYDQYLFSLTENDFLLAPDAMGECCDAHIYQLMDNPESGCTISFNDSLSNIATVDGGVNTNRIGLLGHFNIVCDNAVEQYVMHPTISTLGGFNNLVDPIKDRVSCAELKVLYLLGYDVADAINQVNGCTLPQGGGACDVLAVDDTYRYSLQDNSLDTIIFIRNGLNAVLSNDLLASDTTNFQIQLNNGTITNSNGNTISVSQSEDTLRLQTNSAGAYFIPYTIEGCNDEICDDGFIRVIVTACERMSENCNLTSCYGDFEVFEDSRDLRIILGGQFGNQDGFSFTSPFSAGSPDIRNPRLAPGIATYQLFDCSNGDYNEIDDDEESQGKILALEAGALGDFQFIEGLALPLEDCVLPMEGGAVKLAAFIPSECLALDSFQIRLDFANGFPQNGTIVYETPNYILDSYFINITSSEQTDPIFAEYEIFFNNQTNSKWDHLLVSAVYQGSSNALGSVAIDDIQVTFDRKFPIISSPSTIANVCTDGEITINYEINNPYCSPSDSLTLQLNVPTDLDLDALGAFAENTTIKIAPLAPNESRFLQARLRTNDQTIIGQSTEVILTATPDGCYLPSADTILVNFIDGPLSSLDKTITETSPDNFSIEITVCNSLEDTIRNVQITDQLAPEFQIVNVGVFDFVSSISGNFARLDTLLPPASSGMDACLTFSYTVQAIGNYCPRTLTARASIPESNCNSVSDEVEIEDSDLPKPDANFTFTIDCANGNATFTSVATASGLLHTWIFGDGDSSFVANPTHTYDDFQTYTVVHIVDNGCEPPSEISKELTYEPCPDNFNCTCPNNTNIGIPPIGTTNVSQAGISLNYNNSNQCLKIAGNLLIDSSFTLTGGDVIFEPEASIIVLANQTLTITNANLSSCDNYMWRGIDVQEDGNLVLNGDTISDAIDGVILKRDAIFDIQNTVFDRNFHGIRILQTPIKLGLQNNTFTCSDTLNNGRWGLAGIRVSDAFVSIGASNSNVNEPNTFKDTDYGVVARNAFVTVADATFSNLRFDPTVRRLDNTNSIAVSAGDGGRMQVIDCDIQQVHQAVRISAGEALVFGNTISDVDSAITVRRISLFEKVDINDNNIEAGLRGIAFQEFSFPASATITNNDIDVNFFRYTYINNDDTGPDPVGIAIELFELGEREYADIRNNNIQMQTGQSSIDPLTVGISCISSEGVDIYNNQIFSVGDTLEGGGLAFGISLTDVENVLVSECTLQDSLTNADAVRASAATNVSYCCNTLNIGGEGFGFLGACLGTNLNINTIGQLDSAMNTGVLCQDTTVIGAQIYNVPGSTFEQRHRGNRWTAASYAYGARHRGSDEDIEDSRFIVKNQTSDFYPQNASIADVDPTSFFTTDNTLDQLPKCDENFECNFRSDELSFFNETDLRIANDGFNSEMLLWEANKYLLNKLEKSSFLGELPTELATFRQSLRGSNLERFLAIQNQKKDIFQNHAETVNRLKNLNLELSDLSTIIERANSLSEKRSLISQFESFKQERNEHRQQMNQIAQNWYSNLIQQNASISDDQQLANNESIVNTIQFAYFKEENIELSDLQKEALLSIAKQCPRTGGRFVYRARLLYNLLVENREFDDIQCFLDTDNVIEQRVEEIKPASLPKISLYPNPAFDRVFINTTGSLENQLINVQFIDFAGKILMSRRINDNAEIDISQLQSGIYFCVVSIDEQRSQVEKIVVIK